MKLWKIKLTTSGLLYQRRCRPDNHATLNFTSLHLRYNFCFLGLFESSHSNYVQFHKWPVVGYFLYFPKAFLLIDLLKCSTHITQYDNLATQETIYLFLRWQFGLQNHRKCHTWTSRPGHTNTIKYRWRNAKMASYHHWEGGWLVCIGWPL